jgi:hypothetical protein
MGTAGRAARRVALQITPCGRAWGVGPLQQATARLSARATRQVVAPAAGVQAGTIMASCLCIGIPYTRPALPFCLASLSVFCIGNLDG